MTAILQAAGSDQVAGTNQPESGGELSSADQHPADTATDTQYQEQGQAVVESLRAELAGIDAAFRRLADGTYGRCQACGQSISADRLEALPTTLFCVADAHLAEVEAARP